MDASTTNRPKAPLYSLDGIVIGTLLGSLIAGIYMMVHNYLALGSVRLAKQMLIGGLIVHALVHTIALIAITFAPPQVASQVLTFAFVFAVGQAGLAYLVAQFLQGPSILYYETRGAPIHGLFRSVLVGFLAGILASFVALVLFVLASL